jgi:GNAT superfamily N-acetyltransferase
LLTGETITIATSLESSEGEPVTIECYIIPSQYPRKWVLVTAFANQITIGFVDAQYYGNYATSKIETPHTMRDADENFPHTAIRHLASDDGLFVINDERRRGVGKKLMLTIRAALKGLGANYMNVNMPKESALTFYKKIGMTGDMFGFQDVLIDEEQN